MRVPSEELARAVKRANELEAIEGSPAFKDLYAHFVDQMETANVELVRIPRWNFLRVLKGLLRRDAAMQFIDYVERIKLEGKRAAEILNERDPAAARELRRPSFNHS